MKFDLPVIPEDERTPLVEALLAIIDAQQQRIQQLEETVQQLRDEIAILKGQKPRPKIAPSQLETPPPKPPPTEGTKRPGSEKRSKNVTLNITQEVRVPVPNAPEGSVHLRYEEYIVQELVIEAKATRYLRERIQLPDGSTVLAPLPADVLEGQHFGPELIAYILYQYHQCNVTQPLLLEELQEMGIAMSAGQLSHFLTENLEDFHREKAELLTAGLQVASYIGVDDTGARHQGKNGYCTAIGNDLFAYFESTDSKSRLNFLQVLRGANTGYTINDVTLAYWERQELSHDVVAKLNVEPRQFRDEAAWQARLKELGIVAKLHVRLTTEGALLGQIIEQGMSPNLVILSDGAPQFDVLVHASCWIHAERPLARVVPYNEAHRVAIEQVRQQIWELYRDLKAYRAQPNPAAKATLAARFDAVVGQKSNYPTSIGQVLKEMREHKADLLCVLERPEVPLHNNGMESDIRGYVKVRKISGGTRSAAGRRARDTFSSLKKTCRKLGVNFWAYLKDRIRGLGTIPWIPNLIRQRAGQESAAVPAEAVPA
jgi:transposase IS66 family protein